MAGLKAASRRQGAALRQAQVKLAANTSHISYLTSNLILSWMRVLASLPRRDQAGLTVSMYLSERGDGVILRVLVQTRASTDTIVGPHSDKLKIRITAAPVAGAANKHLLKFLAKKLKVPQGDLYLKSGGASTTKLIVIRGISAAEVRERLR